MKVYVVYQMTIDSYDSDLIILCNVKSEGEAKLNVEVRAANLKVKLIEEGNLYEDIAGEDFLYSYQYIELSVNGIIYRIGYEEIEVEEE